MDLEKLAVDYKNGDEKSFEILYQQTFSLVRFVIYSYIPNSIIVEDLIQDTYMKVNKSIQSYTYHNFKNWIYTIAKNVALDYLRKRKEILLEDDSMISEDRNTHPCLNYVMNHLDEQLKEVFLMKVLCGHTTKMIAEVLNLNPSEVNQLYYRAKSILKKNLKEDAL